MAVANRILCYGRCVNASPLAFNMWQGNKTQITET